jgi:hypothetical protein
MIPFVIAASAIKGALIPELFHSPVLIYVQAFGLIILAKLLVGFGGGSKRRCKW